MDHTPGTEDSPDSLPLQRFLTYRLLRVHSKLNVQASRRLRDVSGLSLAHWRVLAMVATHPGSTPTQISRLSEIDKGQLSRCIKAMQADGLIRTEEDNEDHRQQLLFPTDLGMATYDRTVPRMRARQRFLLSQLTPEEQDMLHGVLDKLEIAAEATEIPE